MTKLKLIEAAKAKGAEVTSEVNKDTGKELIGIRLKNRYVYYWFEIYSWETHVSFNHSYSQNTGKISRSYRQGWVILRSLGLMD